MNRLGNSAFCHKCWVAIDRLDLVRHGKPQSNTKQTVGCGQANVGDACEVWECSVCETIFWSEGGRDQHVSTHM